MKFLESERKERKGLCMELTTGACNNYKAALKPGVTDQIFELKKKGKTVRLRAIRFPLNSGEEEFLITNIVDGQLGIKEFKTLYFKRWGIETKYDELKNKLHIQKFTGDTPLSVE